MGRLSAGADAVLAHFERRRVGEEVCVTLPLVRVRIIGPIFEHQGAFSCVEGDTPGHGIRGGAHTGTSPWLRVQRCWSTMVRHRHDLRDPSPCHREGARERADAPGSGCRYYPSGVHAREPRDSDTITASHFMNSGFGSDDVCHAAAPLARGEPTSEPARSVGRYLFSSGEGLERSVPPLVITPPWRVSLSPGRQTEATLVSRPDSRCDGSLSWKSTCL